MNNFIVGIIGCFLSFQCFANESVLDFNEVDGKIYVAPGSVYVAPDAIYINFNGEFVEVRGISCDSNGVYFEEYAKVRICARCGKELKPGHKCPDKA